MKFAVDDYMPRQLQLTSGMRAILVDWLVEVQQNFELHHETLYLAVELTDLYLAQQLVAKDKLQLLGATALLIASKFEVIQLITIVIIKFEAIVSTDELVYKCMYDPRSMILRIGNLFHFRAPLQKGSAAILIVY